MKRLMRCLFCGLLQDEPEGVKDCKRCGGELVFEDPTVRYEQGSYLTAQMELDQVRAPAGQMIDRHILVTIRSPQNVPEEHAAETVSGRPPLSLSVILDVSGSMHGSKIAHTKQALHMASRILREGDHLSMTKFSNEAHDVMQPRPFDSQTQDMFTGLVDELQPGGSTALFDGLESGLKQARQMRSENNLTILLSDGQANIGVTDLEMIGQLAMDAAQEGLVTSTLGVGMDYNEALMTEIATQGKGRFYHIESPDEIAGFMTGELGEAADMAARDVKIHIHLPDGAALIPLSAAYKCEIIDGEAVVSIGDIPIDLEIEIPLRLTVFAGKVDERLGIDGEITYLSPAGKNLKSKLNRVTVRFVVPAKYKLTDGVIKPVAARIAEQMHARQVLNFSRAYSRHDFEEIENLEKERERLDAYVTLLDQEDREKITSVMKRDLFNLRSGSPDSKMSVNYAYQTQRSMRGYKDRKK